MNNPRLLHAGTGVTLVSLAIALTSLRPPAEEALPVVSPHQPSRMSGAPLGDPVPPFDTTEITPRETCGA